MGLILAGIGLLGLSISYVHFIGNRFHTSVSGYVRDALENELATPESWQPGRKPSELRKKAIDQRWWLKNTDWSVGSITSAALMLIPLFTLVLGVVMAVKYWP